MLTSMSRDASATFSLIHVACYSRSMSPLPICTIVKVPGAYSASLAPLLPRLKKIWADAAYRGQELAAWCKEVGEWELEVVEREPGTRGFKVQPHRWVVERSFSWLSRNRRMSKDYERKVQMSETLIQVAMIRLLVARLGRR
jgi:putative transposase